MSPSKRPRAQDKCRILMRPTKPCLAGPPAHLSILPLAPRGSAGSAGCVTAPPPGSLLSLQSSPSASPQKLPAAAAPSRLHGPLLPAHLQFDTSFESVLPSLLYEGKDCFWFSHHLFPGPSEASVHRQQIFGERVNK